MSLEKTIEELTSAVKTLTIAMLAKTVVDHPEVEVDIPATEALNEKLEKPVKKPKKKAKAKAKKEPEIQGTSVGEGLLEEEPREEVIPEVETAAPSVTRDELMAEASRNLKLMGGDSFLRTLVDGYGYAKFPDIPDELIAEIYTAIKAKNDE